MAAMPVYDFRCGACATGFEAMAAPGATAPCPHCGSADVARVWSAPHLGKQYGLTGAARAESEARRTEREARKRDGGDGGPSRTIGIV
jgi:putative FmdB family regulatory protein